MRITLDENIIKNLASSQSTYQKGFIYYLQKRVSDLNFNYEDNMIYATVEGEEDYSIEISIDDEGEIDYYLCDCPAFTSYDGACKHVVAALLSVQKSRLRAQNNDGTNKERAQASNQLRKNQNASLFSYYEYVGGNNELKAVKLEIALNIELNYGRVTPSVDLKIGVDKMYVIKGIADFLAKLKSANPVEFGKGFTYEYGKHEFTGSSKQIMELLYELYENEKLTKSMENYGYGRQSSAFKGKRAYLSDATLKRLFKILENQSFLLRLNNKEFPNTIILKEELPLKFSLDKTGDNLKLHMDMEDRLVPITSDGKYFFYNGMIYDASEKQIKYFAPLYNRFNENKSDLVFTSEESGRFVSTILPFLKKIGSVKIDKAIEARLYQADLITKVYFDKDGKSITATIEFNYGENKINPFLVNTGAVDNRIIVRDVEGERTVFSHFEKDEFKVKSGAVYQDDEEKIYSFILNSLPKLQESAEIYYSDAFKTMTIKDSKAFSGGVRLNANSDMLEFSFQHDDIDKTELKDIFQALRLKKKYYRLKDGSFIPLDDGHLESMAELMDTLDIKSDDLENKVINLPKYRAMYLDNQLKALGLKQIERNQAFKQLVQNIREPQDMEFEIPDEVSAIMREYQKIGFKWLKTLSAYNMGGILADDMGLGKTLQTIAFVLSYRRTSTLPCLVVAPTSLLYGWQEEAIKFAPQLRVLIVSGLQKQRVEQIQEIKDVDIVVTSYPLIRRDAELYKEIEFGYCFVDEAQHIKNPDSINAKSVKQIRAKGYFALTGTPIENSLTELWSIFDFVMPGYLLSHKKFVEKYEKPIVKENDKGALQRLSSQINPFILRRLKKDVLKELPEKIETRMVADLTEKQKNIYLAYLQQAKAEVAEEIRTNGFQKSQIKILSILTRLRQICCHPAMFIEAYEGGSGKMALLEEVLEDALEGGHRILLFSQFTSMLQIIQKKLESKNIRSLYLNGSTPIEQRSEMVKDFNAGVGDVFLISLKAGGTGLNLTGADMVIHYDPWWNPAVEDQATDRAYRIGQKNTVQVIKLITQGTIEEKVCELQQKKKNLTEALIQPGETFITKLSENEIKMLFDM